MAEETDQNREAKIETRPNGEPLTKSLNGLQNLRPRPELSDAAAAQQTPAPAPGATPAKGETK